MIQIKFIPEEYKLELAGHANAAKEGPDVVCAAASMLFYTLAESLELSRDMLEDYSIREESGNGFIECIPEPKYEGNIMRTYWTILNGFQLLAETYPDNVSFVVENK